MNLAFVQTSQEINFIKSKSSENINFVPVEMGALLYLQIHNIDYLNPRDFMGNKFHQNSISQVENFLANLDTHYFQTFGEKEEYISKIRFLLNASVFVLHLLEKISEKNKIKKIFLSGWNSNQSNLYKRNTVYWVSDIINCNKNNYEIIVLEKKAKNTDEKIDRYGYKIPLIKTKKNSILINSLGYNFYRFIWFNFLKFKKLYFINFNGEKLSLIKKIVFKICGLKIIQANRYFKNSENVSISNLVFSYNNVDLSEFINKEVTKIQTNLFDIEEKIIAFKNLLIDNNFDYYLTNITRGYDGAIIDLLNNKDCKTVSISHGTISESFNEFDKYYKKLISSSVSNGPAKLFALQTKIAKYSIKNTNQNLINRTMETGNLIFANEINSNNKKFILYATTLKPLNGTQLLGVEMFYEYFENLKTLTNIAKKKKINFLINIHMSHAHLKKEMEILFPTLKFTCDKISKVLKKSFVTISFSSTAIEDSLCSFTPVVLFDPQKRYKHCNAEMNPKSRNKALYYVNNEEDLFQAINSVKKSSNIFYDQYIFVSNKNKKQVYETNIANNIKKIFDDKDN